MRSLPVGLVNDDMTGPPDMTTRIVWMLLDVVVAEVWNAGEVARLSEVYDRDYLGHFAPRRVPVSGPAELAQLVVTVRRAFPDLRVVVGDVVGGRSAFAARYPDGAVRRHRAERSPGHRHRTGARDPR
jgi:hypothetical protein